MKKVIKFFIYGLGASLLLLFLLEIITRVFHIDTYIDGGNGFVITLYFIDFGLILLTFGGLVLSVVIRIFIKFFRQ